MLAKLLINLRDWTWVVTFVRWLIISAGTVAESVFMLSTLWVTTDVVAHDLLRIFLSADVIKNINHVCILSFSVLPELIIFSALKRSFDQWMMWRSDKKLFNLSWAVAFTVPTTIFVVVTITTIISFVSLSGHYSVVGWNLVIRCLTGWIYAIVQMLWSSHGEKYIFSQISSLEKELSHAREKLSQYEEKILNLEKKILKVEKPAKIISQRENISLSSAYRRRKEV